ncbi:hypothetical protein LTR08_002594 [Meristemomyces frigidus]|nr:hypothetical protein LTR08_002594 [Meristemomyces frigidus]
MKHPTVLLWAFASCLAASISDEVRPPPYNVAIDRGKSGYYPVHKFFTSDLAAPKTNYLQWSPECDDGLYYFITPKGWSVTQPGPVILDGDGSLIWASHFDNAFGGQAYDLKVQTYRGEDYLTFWLGDDSVRGHGAGEYYMLNASYDIVRKISATNGQSADLHELLITVEGSALMIVFDVIPYDVRPLGRKFSDVWNQAIWDCLFQEINIETGELVFEWRASKHMNITDTYLALDAMAEGTQQNPFDPYHLNSVEKDGLGNYLVSARNPHAILYIHGKTGAVIWTLGGKGNNFMDLSGGHALNFAWQHDARLVSPQAFPESYAPPPRKAGVVVQLLSVFDNAAVDWNYLYGPPYSRGLILELTYPAPTGHDSMGRKRSQAKNAWASGTPLDKVRASLSQQDAKKVANINGTDVAYTVRIVHEYVNPKRVRSSTQGSLQLIPHNTGKEDPAVFIGYGLNAVMTEFSSDGSVICDIHFGSETSWETGNIQSYRAHKSSWIGRPHKPPRAVTKGDKLYVSWNGATEVRSWLLQASNSSYEDSWEDVFPTHKQGFETSFQLPERKDASRYVRVIAIDRDGKVCENGISKTVDRGRVTTLIKQHLNDSGLPTLVPSISVLALQQETLKELLTRLNVAVLPSMWVVRSIAQEMDFGNTSKSKARYQRSKPKDRAS